MHHTTMCSTVSFPRPHSQKGVLISGTRVLKRKSFRPMAPVRAWTSSELSALVRPSCFLRALFLKIGTMSAGCVALSGSGRKLFYQRAS